MYYSTSSIKCTIRCALHCTTEKSYYTYVTNCNDGYYLDTNISHDLRFRNGVCLAVNPGTSDFYEVDAASSIDCEAEADNTWVPGFQNDICLAMNPETSNFYEEVAASRIDCEAAATSLEGGVTTWVPRGTNPYVFSHNISIVLGAAYNDLYREYFDNVDREGEYRLQMSSMNLQQRTIIMYITKINTIKN